jgi:hypothetical protein
VPDAPVVLDAGASLFDVAAGGKFGEDSFPHIGRDDSQLPQMILVRLTLRESDALPRFHSKLRRPESHTASVMPAKHSETTKSKRTGKHMSRRRNGKAPLRRGFAHGSECCARAAKRLGRNEDDS